MTESTSPTLAELQEQLAATQLEIDKRQLAPLTAIINALDNETIDNAMTVIQTNLPELTGEKYQQAQNILTVLSNSPRYLLSQRDEIEARANPQPAEEPVPA